MPNLYLISGTDEFIIRQQAGELIKRLCGERPEENPCLEIVHGDSTNIKPYQMLDEMVLSIQTPDLFGEQKTIWLKRFDFSQISKNNNIKTAVSNLAKALKAGLPEDVTIVLDGVGIDKRSALFKACKNFGEIHIFEKIDVKSREWEQNLRIRLMKTCQEYGVRIIPEAAVFLSETSGTDTGRVLSELQKLIAYISPRDQITVEDCLAICSITPEAAGWAFSDALAARNLKKSLSTLHILFNNKELGRKVIYSVISRFQEMVEIKVAATQLSISRNVNYNRFKNIVENAHPELKEKLKDNIILKSHPYRAFMLFLQSANFTNTTLVNSLSAILKTNRELVSGSCDPRIALELLSAKICR